jgi:hypothetical protein
MNRKARRAQMGSGAAAGDEWYGRTGAARIVSAGIGAHAARQHARKFLLGAGTTPAPASERRAPRDPRTAHGAGVRSGVRRVADAARLVPLASARALPSRLSGRHRHDRARPAGRRGGPDAPGAGDGEARDSREARQQERGGVDRVREAVGAVGSTRDESGYGAQAGAPDVQPPEAAPVARRDRALHRGAVGRSRALHAGVSW